MEYFGHELALGWLDRIGWCYIDRDFKDSILKRGIWRSLQEASPTSKIILVVERDLDQWIINVFDFDVFFV